MTGYLKDSLVFDKFEDWLVLPICFHPSSVEVVNPN